MFLDYAHEFGVPLAHLAPPTSARLGEMLDIEQPKVGALDFWIGDADRHSNTGNLLQVLAEDPGTAAVMAFTTYGESARAGFAPNVADACRRARAQTAKPIFATTYTSRQVNPALMLQLADEGIPLLDGMRASMYAMRHAFDVREFRSRWSDGGNDDTPFDAFALSRARTTLQSSTQLLEAEALSLLGGLGVPVVPTLRAVSEDEAVTAASSLGYPVVVKTDEGITHKAARGGVRLGLGDDAAVREAYRTMAAVLGPRVVVAPMRRGLEVALGVVPSEFGPVIMLSAGGVMIEMLSDRCYLLAPASPEEIAAALADLTVWRVARSTLQASTLESFCDIACRVSRIAYELRDVVKELDINPVLVSDDGCVAIDALVGTYRESEEA